MAWKTVKIYRHRLFLALSLIQSMLLARYKYIFKNLYFGICRSIKVSYQSIVANFLEDLQKFNLINFSITVFVDLGDQVTDFLLGGLSSSIHVFKGIIDQAGYFSDVKSSAVIFVVSTEDSINGISKLLFAIWHW